jgi:glycerate 2-kinase
MSHLITNWKNLAISKERKDALTILEAGLQAIETGRAIQDTVKLQGLTLIVQGHRYNLSKYRHTYVIGIGKAAADACLALEKILGKKITDGISLDVKIAPLKRIKSLLGTHPFPSLQNMRATGEILGILKHVEHDDLVIVVVSGGGSALLCWPFELKCEEMVTITRELMKRGAPIEEINTVRKHLSEIQGGQLARMAYPAHVLGLIFSDVPGDDLGMIASGPTVMDLTTVEDAKRIMVKYDLLRACKLPNCEVQETPKDPLYFQHTTNLLVMSNRVALDAMEKQAKKLGYRVRVHSNTLRGEAREVGRVLAGIPNPGEVVLAAGETTVTVKGKGTGGRNQELALGALMAIDDATLVLSCASDGIDNSSHAGAIADRFTKEQATRKKLKAENYLAKNDSLPFFEATESFIETGKTGANVSDVMLALRK